LNRKRGGLSNLDAGPAKKKFCEAGGGIKQTHRGNSGKKKKAHRPTKEDGGGRPVFIKKEESLKGQKKGIPEMGRGT